jgi:hypothetical protein
VLLGQQRGGRQEGHLLAAGDGHEGRAQGHLGLAEAHVAADQAVHGRGLIMSWITAWMAARWSAVSSKPKSLAKARSRAAVAEGMAFARGAAGVDVEQLGGRVAHLLGGLALGLFPLAAAQLVQRRLVGAHAGVAADQVQLADRHVEHGLVGVFQVQELLQRGRAVGSSGPRPC